MPAYQQRQTQSSVNASRLTGSAVDAAKWKPSGRNPDGANDFGSANKPGCGDAVVQPVGRARVIHMLWNGFLSIGVESSEMRCDIWVPSWPAVSRCTGRLCAETSWAAWVHTAGSGSVAAANRGRSEDPAIRATKTLSATTTAVVDRHRRVVPVLPRPTVAALYKRTLVHHPQEAVKSVKVWHVSLASGGLPKPKTVAGACFTPHRNSQIRLLA